MWGLRLVLLASLVVLVVGAALFSSAGPEVWSEQRAQATLLPGTSGPGRGDLRDVLSFARQGPQNPVGAAERAFGRWTDPGVVVRAGGGVVMRLAQTTGRGGSLPWWAEAAGGPGDGFIVPLWDLLAISVMVVTFSILLGSWARKGH